MSIDIANLADEYWEHELRTNPTTALLLGDHRHGAEMENLTRAAEDDAIAALHSFADRAEAIDPAPLSNADRITRGVLVEEARGKAGELESRMAEFDVNPSMGLHIELPQIASQIQLPGADEAEAIVVKWSKLKETFEQAVQRLRQGLAINRTPPQIAVEKSIDQINRYLATPVADDPFLTIAPPSTFTESETAAWRTLLEEQVVSSIRPGYELYRNALAEEILAKARPQEKTGLRWLPDGE